MEDLQIPYSPLSNPDDIEIPSNMNDLKVPFPCSPLSPLNTPLVYSPLSNHGDLEVPMDIEDEKKLEIVNNSDSIKGQPEANQNPNSNKELILRLISSIVSMNKKNEKSNKGKPETNQNSDSKNGQPEATQNQIVQGGNYT